MFLSWFPSKYSDVFPPSWFPRKYSDSDMFPPSWFPGKYSDMFPPSWFHEKLEIQTIIFFKEIYYLYTIKKHHPTHKYTSYMLVMLAMP